ncbi:hypothetical protein BOX15_Mlig019070g1 [Macrostomum lignano]|uniref:Gustatory receptor n=2 Tax=Macrostomum lignano TaxID=282301 RepID=A0A267ED12_9PLAT|nr:hypothetical protein BOX15_Mlig019070g1 [Macrostomum lignano]
MRRWQSLNEFNACGGKEAGASQSACGQDSVVNSNVGSDMETGQSGVANPPRAMSMRVKPRRQRRRRHRTAAASPAAADRALPPQPPPPTLSAADETLRDRRRKRGISEVSSVGSAVNRLFFENEAFQSDEEKEAPAAETAAAAIVDVLDETPPADSSVMAVEIPATLVIQTATDPATETLETDTYEDVVTLRIDKFRSCSAAVPDLQLDHATDRRQRRRRVGVSPPTPELLETLQRLKRSADADSDESAAYTTDCGTAPHRRQSSLISGADDTGSVYYGVPQLASPLAPNSRLLSAPDLARLRKASRQSMLSDAGGSSAAGRVDKKLAAQRAVRLDYQFASSSARHSLQKLGQRSLSQLEDLAQIGHSEQGTNYKRSYVSLYSPLHPLFMVLKLFGVFHTRQKGGRAAPKFTNSYIYSGLVLLAAWFNALRFFFVYDWGQEKFDSLLFFKLTQHAIYIQTAVATSVMFRASGKFPRFFKACHEFMGKRHNLAYRFALSRRTKITVAVGALVMVLELATYLSWVARADSGFLRVFMRPYTLVVPWTQASRGILTCLEFIFSAFSAAAWVYPALLFCSFTWIFEREFRYLAHRLRLACTNDYIFVGDIEKFRAESWRISRLVTKLDDLFNFYVFVLFLTDVLSVCLILYNLVVGQYPHDGSAVQAWFWLLSALVRLFGVTISAAKVNQAACSPLNIIQDMNLRDYAVNPAKISQLMIFLNKLTIGNIGFTAWNLFTLSRTSTLTIAAMILSYTLLFVKLGASYGQDDRLRAQTIATPTVATTYGLRLGNSTDYWTLSTAHWAT